MKRPISLIIVLSCLLFTSHFVAGQNLYPKRISSEDFSEAFLCESGSCFRSVTKKYDINYHEFKCSQGSGSSCTIYYTYDWLKKDVDIYSMGIYFSRDEKSVEICYRNRTYFDSLFQDLDEWFDFKFYDDKNNDDPKTFTYRAGKGQRLQLIKSESRSSDGSLFYVLKVSLLYKEP